MKLEMKKANPWSLSYAVIFSLISLSFAFDSLDHLGKAVWYWGWFVVYYILLNIGNYSYLLMTDVKGFRRYWKFLFPLFIISFVFSILEDVDEMGGIGILIFIAFLFLPAFIWNYKLAYGKDKLDNSVKI